MTNLLGYSIILSAIILLSSCGKSEKQIKAENEKIRLEKFEQQSLIDEKAITDLSIKYNSISQMDTIDAFTYVIQEMFIDRHKPICFEGEMTDIAKVDSTYTLTVINNPKFFIAKLYMAQISLAPEKFSELENQMKSNTKSNEGGFIFKVSNIINIRPELQRNTIYIDDDKITYVIQGELIDFYLKTKVEDINE